MGLSRNNDVVDQRLLDLLVDGELSDEQERAVIARLEDASGWLAALRVGLSREPLLAACRRRSDTTVSW